MGFQSLHLIRMVLRFGILSVTQRQRCQRKNIRLVDAASEATEKTQPSSCCLSGDVMSKDTSLRATQLTLACSARVRIHFPSKIRCFQREQSST